jgi:hypothetical protein
MYASRTKLPSLSQGVWQGTGSQILDIIHTVQTEGVTSEDQFQGVYISCKFQNTATLKNLPTRLIFLESSAVSSSDNFVLF